MPLPQDYAERVYAGVLGKLIGVYLGRPFEGWSYERILAELGEIEGYVHDRLGLPLIVTDDDISGTFTFLRALPDYGPDVTPAQIGDTWLNYIVPGRTILWWGGLGVSTEHTAYLRLKKGIPAPESGSAALNSKVVSEQIGAQIFSDGWAMVAPGDPERAADFARRAASVSHDSEAIYGAQVVAAMEAQAFAESDIHRLMETARRLIPTDSLIRRVMDDLQAWHAAEPDWRRTRAKVAATYGYDRFGGGCHIIPNHALIHLALLYGGHSFAAAQTIVNTSGWDTDCNAGNVGCLMGIRQGLAAFAGGPDWRGPVADRLYLSTADGGRAITDAVTETYHIVNCGRALAGLAPLAPKGGARFHFSLPGSVQGFTATEGGRVENAGGRLLIQPAPGQMVRATTPTFIPPEARQMPGYQLLASPTLSPGQTVRATVTASEGAAWSLCVGVYDEKDEVRWIRTTEKVPDTGGYPICAVGLEVTGGPVYLDSLTWDGAPDVTLTRTPGGSMWKRAWVNGVDDWPDWWEPFRLIQNEGTGLVIHGGRDWTDYRVTATVTPHLAAACGIGARVQGMRRYYALLLRPDGGGHLCLKKGSLTLAEAPFAWEWDQAVTLSLEVEGNRIRAFADGRLAFELVDPQQPLTGGGVALLVTEGTAAVDAVQIEPLTI